jgi:uncharacterized membrane protein
VSCLASDDRNNDSNGFKIIKKQEHPILQGLPWNNAPTVCGYNMVVPKDGSEILLTLRGIESLGEDRIERIKLSEKEHPLLIINDYGKGKALAFTTDIAPHWAGGMVDWGSERIKKGNCELGSLYAQFLYQMIDWLGE